MAQYQMAAGASPGGQMVRNHSPDMWQEPSQQGWSLDRLFGGRPSATQASNSAYGPSAGGTYGNDGSGHGLFGQFATHQHYHRFLILLGGVVTCGLIVAFVLYPEFSGSSHHVASAARIKASSGSSGQRYNCKNFDDIWSHAKSSWCCLNEDFGCPLTPASTTGPALAAAPPKYEWISVPVSSLPKAQAQILPYDCTAGDSNWRKGWSEGKKTWCCDHSGVGCEHASSALFDCDAGFSNWALQLSNMRCFLRLPPVDAFAGFADLPLPLPCPHGWSSTKKGWCCDSYLVGCEEAVSEPFDCTAGFSNWQHGWSGGKQDWCCQHYQRGCVPVAASEPYDCVAGYYNWNAGWLCNKVSRLIAMLVTAIGGWDGPKAKSNGAAKFINVVVHKRANHSIVQQATVTGKMAGRPAKGIGVVVTTSVAVLPPPQVNPMIAMLVTAIGGWDGPKAKSNGAAKFINVVVHKRANHSIVQQATVTGKMAGRPAKRIGVVSTTSVAVLPPPQVSPMIAMLVTAIGGWDGPKAKSNGAAKFINVVVHKRANHSIVQQASVTGKMAGRPAKRIGVVSTTSVAVLPPPQVNPMIAMLATRIGRRACLTGNSNGAAGTTIAAVQLQWGVKRTIAKGLPPSVESCNECYLLFVLVPYCSCLVFAAFFSHINIERWQQVCSAFNGSVVASKEERREARAIIWPSKVFKRAGGMVKSPAEVSIAESTSMQHIATAPTRLMEQALRLRHDYYWPSHKKEWCCNTYLVGCSSGGFTAVHAAAFPLWSERLGAPGGGGSRIGCPVHPNRRNRGAAEITIAVASAGIHVVEICACRRTFCGARSLMIGNCISCMLAMCLATAWFVHCTIADDMLMPFAESLDLAASELDGVQLGLAAVELGNQEANMQMPNGVLPSMLSWPKFRMPTREELIAMGMTPAQADHELVRRNELEVIEVSVTRWVMAFGCVICISLPAGIVFFFYLVFSSLMEREQECDVPLLWWCYVAVFNIFYHLNFGGRSIHRQVIRTMCRYQATEQNLEPPPPRVRAYHLLTSIFVFAWHCVGLHWIRISTTCKDTAPHLHRAVSLFASFYIVYTLFTTISTIGLQRMLATLLRRGLLPVAMIGHDRVAPEGTMDLQQTVMFDSEQFGECQQCPTCLEDFTKEQVIKQTVCGHYFHEACLAQWLKLNRTCPLCRRDLAAGLEQGTTETTQEAQTVPPDTIGAPTTSVVPISGEVSLTSPPHSLAADTVLWDAELGLRPATPAAELTEATSQAAASRPVVVSIAEATSPTTAAASSQRQPEAVSRAVVVAPAASAVSEVEASLEVIAGDADAVERRPSESVDDKVLLEVAVVQADTRRGPEERDPRRVEVP
ncbi:unnamed protein product [Polarella glacialis]|uniref:RING-type domain-containing protein n=1 Tax=Polarella glacialis TaxID=89957 RepID=A0A813IQ22_POLGL|nr:unnamed protein product [Polarella glacialis]